MKGSKPDLASKTLKSPPRLNLATVERVYKKPRSESSCYVDPEKGFDEPRDGDTLNYAVRSVVRTPNHYITQQEAQASLQESHKAEENLTELFNKLNNILQVQKATVIPVEPSTSVNTSIVKNAPCKVLNAEPRVFAESEEKSAGIAEQASVQEFINLAKDVRNSMLAKGVAINEVDIRGRSLLNYVVMMLNSIEGSEFEHGAHTMPLRGLLASIILAEKEHTSAQLDKSGLNEKHHEKLARILIRQSCNDGKFDKKKLEKLKVMLDSVKYENELYQVARLVCAIGVGGKKGMASFQEILSRDDYLDVVLNEALIYAIQENADPFINYIMKVKQSVRQIDYNNCSNIYLANVTPLQQAILSKRLDVGLMLLQDGAAPSGVDLETVLMDRQADQDHVFKVHLLLKIFEPDRNKKIKQKISELCKSWLKEEGATVQSFTGKLKVFLDDEIEIEKGRPVSRLDSIINDQAHHIATKLDNLLHTKRSCFLAIGWKRKTYMQRSELATFIIDRLIEASCSGAKLPLIRRQMSKPHPSHEEGLDIPEFEGDIGDEKASPWINGMMNLPDQGVVNAKVTLKKSSIMIGMRRGA